MLLPRTAANPTIPPRLSHVSILIRRTTQPSCRLASRLPQARLALLALALACGPDPAGEGQLARRSTRSPVLPARPGDVLVDVTDGSGLDFVHVLVDGELSNVAESLGAGVAVLDADDDGRLDIYLVQGAHREGVVDGPPPAQAPRNRLYRNLGELRFVDVSDGSGADDPGFGVAAVAGDADGDGRADLYLCNLGANRLLRARGQGRFEDATAASGTGDEGFSTGAGFFDADGDGDLDLYVANYLGFDPDYAYFYAPDAFPPPLAYPAQADRLFVNRGDGRFDDRSEQSGITSVAARGMAVLASDLDGDGLTDVFVTNDASANFLWRNLGDGRFEDVAQRSGVAWGVNGEATAAMTVDRGDCDGDGLLDLVVTDISYGSLYRGLGGGLFADDVRPSGLAALGGRYVSWGGGFLDVDADADLDLLVVNGDLHHLVGWEDLLLLNDGSGHFQDGASLSAYLDQKLMGRGGAIADLDDDGDLDVLVSNLADRLVLLRNDSDGRNAWITLDLQPGPEGRTPYGAIVRVEAGGRTQVRELRCPTTYLCCGDPRLFFGLGPVERVERIDVRWPWGASQELVDVPVRQRLAVSWTGN